MLYNGDGKYIVGLTGMSGAGKSTACRVFEGRGFHVVDCDKAAREVTEKDSPALAMIAGAFGEAALNTDGTFDRRAVGNIVFADKEKLDILQEIIFPFIIYRVNEHIYESESRLILVDAPTLFESGADKLCDAVVSVTADPDVCVRRIMERDGLSVKQARDRLSSQKSESFYAERSLYSIGNNGDKAALIRRAEEIADKVGDGNL